MQLLLSGRPIGRVIRLVRPSACLFVCLSLCLSACLSVSPSRSRNSETKNVEKSKLVQTFPMARVSGMPTFNLKGQRSSKPSSKTSKNFRISGVRVYFRAADQA